MNLLVYKGEAQTTAARRDHVSAPPDASVSEVLMSKLAVKGEMRRKEADMLARYSPSNFYIHLNGDL